MMVVIPLLVEMIRALILEIRTKLKAHFNKPSGVVIKVSYTLLMHGWYADLESRDDKYLYDSIIMHISKSNVVIQNAQCKLDFTGLNKHEFIERLTRGKIILTPADKLSLDDVVITFTEEHEAPISGNKNSQEKKTITCSIWSVKGITRVNEFINKCYHTYINLTLGVTDPSSVFIQTRDDKLVVFDQFTPNNLTTFDGIFFDQKNELIHMLDKYMERARNVKKVNLLLHGVPGCGKSSIIKAIANYTNYSIIVIKLSYMNNDSDILNALYDTGIKVDKGRMSKYVPLGNRIYVFEDIDAECEIVKSRSNETSNDDSVAKAIGVLIKNNKDKSDNKSDNKSDDKKQKNNA
jgi:hypothetical protein